MTAITPQAAPELPKNSGPVLNRKQRRKVAKANKLPWGTVKSGMARRLPIDLGIKKFKKISKDHETRETYRENARKSYQHATDELRKTGKVGKWPIGGPMG